MTPGRPRWTEGRWARALAFVLSLLSPGAGQFLLGGIGRGVAWALGTTVVTFGVLAALPVSLGAIAGAVALGALLHAASAVDALRMRVGSPPWTVVVAAWAALLVLGGAVHGPVGGYYRAHRAQAFTIPSPGMAPTLLVGDYVLTDNAVYRREAPRRGDIIVFKYPRDERRAFIKRIVGVPGDRIAVRGPEVYIDGQRLAEPYVQGGESPAAGPCTYPYGCEAITVPNDSYFVMGDNRDHSQDSRHWGPVGREKIVGRAFAIYWSWDGARGAPRLERVGRSLSGG